MYVFLMDYLIPIEVSCDALDYIYLDSLDSSIYFECVFGRTLNFCDIDIVTYAFSVTRYIRYLIIYGTDLSHAYFVPSFSLNRLENLDTPPLDFYRTV